MIVCMICIQTHLAKIRPKISRILINQILTSFQALLQITLQSTHMLWFPNNYSKKTLFMVNAELVVDKQRKRKLMNLQFTCTTRICAIKILIFLSSVTLFSLIANSRALFSISNTAGPSLFLCITIAKPCRKESITHLNRKQTSATNKLSVLVNWFHDMEL